MKTRNIKKKPQIKLAPNENKHFFVGISLADNNTTESGISVLNRDLQIIRLEKVYTNQEIETFLANFIGLRDSIVCISLPINSMHLSSKWRQDEKSIHAFSLYNSSEDMHWIDRFADRGIDLYDNLIALGINTYRYHVHLAKLRLNLLAPFKQRSQPGCKYLQTVIRDLLSVDNLPSNLVPIASLDSIIGGYLGWKIATDKENEGYTFLESFKNQQVAVPIKQNPGKIPIEELKIQKKK